MSFSLSSRLVAELVGTFAFVFVGAGSAVAMSAALSPPDPAAALLVASLANGLGLAVAVTATMNISGGSLNPAVTLALFLSKKLRAGDVIPYIVAELGGSVLAVLTLMAAIPSSLGQSSGWGAPSLAHSMTPAGGTLLELAMTVVLTFAIFWTAVSKAAPKVGGFGIGLAVAADVLLGGPLTGAAMNPARAFGPMIASLSIPNYWYIYLVGPIAGALLVAALYMLMPDPSTPTQGSGINTSG